MNEAVRFRRELASKRNIDRAFPGRSVLRVLQFRQAMREGHRSSTPGTPGELANAPASLIDGATSLGRGPQCRLDLASTSARISAAPCLDCGGRRLEMLSFADARVEQIRNSFANNVAQSVDRFVGDAKVDGCSAALPGHKTLRGQQ